ncbi:MAG TPA: GGDEF domain-containing protein [Mycobacterium sp.]|nr:GGDEF domain-containing protein [Mycobacterium sp.]
MYRGGVRIAAAAMAAPLIVLAVWLWQGWGGAFTAKAADDLGQLFFAGLASVCALRAAARNAGRARGSWLALGVGLAAWAAGELMWCYYDLWPDVNHVPFPSVADAGFLLFPIGAGLALLLFPAARGGQSRGRLILDGALVAGSLFVVSWVSALGDVYSARSDGDLAFMVSLAYPVADLVIMTMAIVVLARARTAHRLSLVLLSAGIMLMAVSDSAFVYLNAIGAYHSGSLTDLGWAAAFAALGLAALSSRSETENDPVQQSANAWFWLPYLPVLIAGAIGLRHAMSSLGSSPVPAVAVILVATLLARQLVVLAENRRLLLTVTHQALRDPLTGLANRALFLDRLNQAIQDRRRELTPLAVMSLDLDHFKQVNDTLGHPAGDELLVRVAERLLGSVRTTDTVARLGGDEFAVVIQGDVADALLVADRVAEAFTRPFILEGHPCPAKPSIGLTVAAGEAADITIEDLLKQADLAMYEAKKTRNGHVHTYTAELHSTQLGAQRPLAHRHLRNREPTPAGATRSAVAQGHAASATGATAADSIWSRWASGRTPR